MKSHDPTQNGVRNEINTALPRVKCRNCAAATAVGHEMLIITHSLIHIQIYIHRKPKAKQKMKNIYHKHILA